MLPSQPLKRQALVPAPESKARFIEPMLLQRTQSLPEGPGWAYEVKLDGYRALAIKTKGKVLLQSRNNEDFNGRYPGIVSALGEMPDETVVDGEVVALDDSGRPSFNALQNVGSSKVTLVYYVFDVLILAGRNVMEEPLSRRADLLRRQVLTRLGEPVRESSQLNASLRDLITAVKAHGFEGIVAKRLEGPYHAGHRRDEVDEKDEEITHFCMILRNRKTADFRANQEFAIHKVASSCFCN